MNAKQFVFNELDCMNTGDRFTGHALMQLYLQTTGIMHYPSTFLRHVREYREHTGADIQCIDKPKSLYEIL